MKKIRLLVIPFVTGCLLACSPSYLLNGQKGTASTIDIEEVYDFGTIFKAPTVKRSGVTLNSVIIFPDGSATYENIVKLNQSGTYTLRYSGLVDNKAYGEEYSFVVKNQYFTFSGDNSSASFENSDRTYGYEGLWVNLVNGESITFNQEIDVSKVSKNDNLFTFYAAPENVGKNDFSELDITFTDVSDSENYLKIRVKATQDGLQYPYSYIDAGGNGQDYVGLERNNVHVNTQFGCPIVHSFYGYYTATGQGVGKNVCSLSFDTSTCSLYANTGMTQVTDFDNSKYYSTIWDGFKSGKVRVSASAVGATNAGARFVIKNIKDVDLSKTVIEDNTPPEITINHGYDTLPQAKVGAKYPVFDATALDNLSGNVDVKASVYYVKNGIRFDVNNNDGYFNVDRSGTYEIVYVAKDIVGNVKQEKLVVTTTDSYKEMTIVPRKALVEEIKRGETYTLPEFRISNGSGHYQTRYEVTCDDKLVEISSKNTFVPTEMGVYKVKFIATDVTLSTKTYEYDVSVLYNEGCAFVGEPELQKYLIAGYENLIPELYAVDYGNGAKKVLADVIINCGGNETTIKSGEKFTPTVSENFENVTLTYKAGNKTLAYALPCVQGFEGKYVKIGNYFKTQNSSIDTTSLEDKTRVSSVSNSTSSFEFANPLVAQSFTTVLSMEEGKTNYNYLNVVLTDKLNPDQKVTVKMKLGSLDNLAVQVGNSVIKTDLPFGSEREFSITYRDGMIYFNKSGVAVSTYDDGTPFNGFSSNFIYFSMSMEGLSAPSSFFISQIANQTIIETKADRMEPVIVAVDKYGGFSELNDVVSTARVIAADVLDPSCSVVMNVTAPDNSVVVDHDGTRLYEASPKINHIITVDQYGQYAINYIATDKRGNEAAFVYSIGILDNEKPVITVTSGYTKSCKTNETIIIPDYKVSDNLDKSEDLQTYVSIVCPSGQVVVLPEGGNALKATQAGTYVVTINCFDTAGNIAKFSYKVEVK